MTNRLRNQIEEASRLKLELDKLAGQEGGFASKLASLSMASHIDDLAQQRAIEASASLFEHVVSLHKTNVIWNIAQMVGCR